MLTINAEINVKIIPKYPYRSDTNLQKSSALKAGIIIQVVCNNIDD